MSGWSKVRALRYRQLCYAVLFLVAMVPSPVHILHTFFLSNCIVRTPVMTQFRATHDEIQTSCEGLSVTFDPALGFMFDLRRWCSSSKPQTRADSMELCRGASRYVPDQTETSVMTDGPPLPDAPQQGLLSHLWKVWNINYMSCSYMSQKTH